MILVSQTEQKTTDWTRNWCDVPKKRKWTAFRVVTVNYRDSTQLYDIENHVSEKLFAMFSISTE